ncbi:alcohol dehydrogenase catalytic domain-containing protein [Microbacterium ulmi]|uniref:Alcohol dehydrogenase catalytic domain-containing protein n=1 Tax=Microbacterium ulmi TaxID=179095 RepID=A0A7Y2Q266_9MICO|nr:alcohol dehydrogenase catalytic domain-containing protein [Microbacterium ulmi]NII68892.1 threonine dehydrogenase-like Zn-dependent dehydrogenase [Microbacterium ulmi]NNH05112.1 alcohol dehydrogenase catalytic domain-containing protein [Microbacterium ulmi]
MRATYMFGAGDVRVIEVPDASIERPTDALVRVTAACVCGSDLHPFHSLPETPAGRAMGHEFVGIVEDVGAEVTTIRRGDFVIAPFVWSDGTCDFCREGLQTSCRHGGVFGTAPGVGGQAEAVRVPQADGTLVVVHAAVDESLVPSLLTLSDVYGTGWHAAVTGGVAPVRAYIERLLPGVLDGSVDPGRVFDREVPLDETPGAYRAMDAREALKVLVRP